MGIFFVFGIPNVLQHTHLSLLLICDLLWQEFKDIFQYIAKIRPKAEEYGICRIIPPDSWKPPILIKGNRFVSSKFGTHVQQIDALKDLFSKRKLNKIIEQTKSDHGSHGFEFESGPEFTLPAYKQYAEHFKRNYFHKRDIFTDNGTPLWENVEGEYWRIVQNPTEEIQVYWHLFLVKTNSINTKIRTIRFRP